MSEGKRKAREGKFSSVCLNGPSRTEGGSTLQTYTGWQPSEDPSDTVSATEVKTKESPLKEGCWGEKEEFLAMLCRTANLPILKLG